VVCAGAPLDTGAPRFNTGAPRFIGVGKCASLRARASPLRAGPCAGPRAGPWNARAWPPTQRGRHALPGHQAWAGKPVRV